MTTERTAHQAALEAAMAVYDRNVDHWIADGLKGQFAMLHGGEMAATAMGYGQALEIGYARFGLNEPFFVKEIGQAPVFCSRLG